MKIANNMGCPTRTPLLVVEEYDHWKMRMERFFIGKEKGVEIWRSVIEGTHILIRQAVRDDVATLMGQEKVRLEPLMANDIENIHADNIVFS